LNELPIISIIDDDASVREAMRALLRSMGYIARTFPSAEVYLNSGQIDETDCLITDVMMPGMNGVELQEQLVREGWRIPVIIITAYPDERLRSRVSNANSAGFLRKPFSDEQLIACLDKLFTSKVSRKSSY